MTHSIIATARTDRGRRSVRFEMPDGAEHIVEAMRHRWYEERMLVDAQRRLRAQSGFVVDVGAYVGTHSLWFALVCGRAVLALEPVMGSYQALVRNVALNNAQALVQARDVAAGAARQHGRMHQLSANTGNSQLQPDEDGPVAVYTLDEIIEDAGGDKVALVKIDVEGTELDVLRGAAELLERDHPLLYIEAADDEVRLAVEEYLGPFGYTSFGHWNATPTFGYSA